MPSNYAMTGKLMIFIPSTCVCGEIFAVNHIMICKWGGFVIHRHNELRDLKGELLNTVLSDLKVGCILQDIIGEQLSWGANKVEYSHTWNFLGTPTIGYLWCQGLPPKCQIVEGPRDTTDLQNAWKWEEASILKQSSWRWTQNIHALSIHYNQWNGPGTLEVPQSPCGADSPKEGETVR